MPQQIAEGLVTVYAWPDGWRLVRERNDQGIATLQLYAIQMFAELGTPAAMPGTSGFTVTSVLSGKRLVLSLVDDKAEPQAVLLLRRSAPDPGGYQLYVIKARKPQGWEFFTKPSLHGPKTSKPVIDWDVVTHLLDVIGEFRNFAFAITFDVAMQLNLPMLADHWHTFDADNPDLLASRPIKLPIEKDGMPIRHDEDYEAVSNWISDLFQEKLLDLFSVEDLGKVQESNSIWDIGHVYVDLMRPLVITLKLIPAEDWYTNPRFRWVVQPIRTTVQIQQRLRGESEVGVITALHNADIIVFSDEEQEWYDRFALPGDPTMPIDVYLALGAPPPLFMAHESFVRWLEQWEAERG